MPNRKAEIFHSAFKKVELLWNCQIFIEKLRNKTLPKIRVKEREFFCKILQGERSDFPKINQKARKNATI